MNKFEHGGNVFGKNIRIDFSVNTNPLGTDKKIIHAVKAASDKYGLYPDPNHTALKKAISIREGITPDMVAVSNGASEMIFAAVRAVMPRRAVLVSPTFSEYERALLSVGCKIEYYDTSEENDFIIGADITEHLDGADMLFLCNPNNPTGRLCQRDILAKIAKKRIICIADECFMDFAEGYTMAGTMPVIKAFTKIYAMAGLRLGYMTADKDFISAVERQLPAWNISAPAEAAGIAALEMSGYVEKTAALIRREREYLSSSLKNLGFTVFKSDVNFILFKGREGLESALIRRGILIRGCANFRGLDKHFYRIAVKKHAENEILIGELGEINWQNR